MYIYTHLHIHNVYTRECVYVNVYNNRMYRGKKRTAWWVRLEFRDKIDKVRKKDRSEALNKKIVIRQATKGSIHSTFSATESATTTSLDLLMPLVLASTLRIKTFAEDLSSVYFIMYLEIPIFMLNIDLEQCSVLLFYIHVTHKSIIILTKTNIVCCAF